MGVHKKFSPDLYKKYDEPGIQAILTYLDSVGVYAKKGADKYGVDVVTYAGYRPAAYIEVEVVSAWHGGSFPYKDCHVLERKAKWMMQGIGLPVSLYRLRADLEAAIIVPDYALENASLEEVPNRLVGSGEYMYCVPIDDLEQVELCI